MKKIKKSLSLLLSLLMILGMVVLPSPVSAEGKEGATEVPYTNEIVDGNAYKTYNFTDLFGTPDLKKRMKSGELEISEPLTPKAVRGSASALGEEIPDAEHYMVDVVWTTYDLKPGDLGTPVYFQIYDKTTKTIIAQTDIVTARGKYKFKKTDGWDKPGVSHDPSNWQMRAPNEYRFDIHLKTGDGGYFPHGNICALISQRGNPIYRAEYHTNKAIPSIEVQRTNKDDITDTVPINKENLGENQYYSWAQAIDGAIRKPFYQGKEMDIQKYGNDTLESLQVSDDITAGRVKMAMKAPGKTGFDRGPGTFEDNGTPYHYEVTGDYIKLHIFTIRQDLTVNFDSNGATWKTGAPAAQTIGHSMKLGDKWAGLGPITVPTEADLKAPVVKPGEKEKKFIGWNTDKNATTALFTDNTYDTPITKDETFYAIYQEKPQGKAKAVYKDKDTNAPIADKYKIDGKDYPAELTGNKDEKIADAVFDKKNAPTFIGYEIDSIGTDPVPQNVNDTANYTENGDYTVVYKYKKLDNVIPQKDPNGGKDNVKPDGYVTVAFKAGDNGKINNGTADINYFVNPVENVTFGDNSIKEPTITANDNYNVKDSKWDPKLDDAKKAEAITADATFTAQYEEKAKKDVEFTFEFYNSKKPSEQITASVLKGRFEPTVPEKQVGNYVGSDITLPTFENKEVKTGDLQGTWKFDGWYRGAAKLTDAKVSENDAENKLVGKWILTETETAKVTREFAIDPAIVGDGKDVPAGHALPEAVKKQTPNVTTNYIGSEQTPGKDKFDSVVEKIGDKEGTWTFKEWDKAKLTVDANEAMNKFIGTWTWTEKGKINIKYVFKAVGTNRPLLQAILDQKPADTSGYQAPADPTLPAVASHDVIEKGDKVGTWTRGNKWEKATDTNGNITYTLTWTFKEIKSDDPVINPVKPDDKKIQGKGVPGSTVKVTIPGVKDPIEIKVGQNGDWTVDVPKDKKLKDGDVIKAKQKTTGLPESNEVSKKVEGNTPSGSSPSYGHVSSKKVDTHPKTDIHALYLYGYPGKTVHPKGDMTRAEAAAMVARLKNLDMSDTSKPDFKDVESHWYNSAINAVVKAGLMKGYPDGTFVPNGKITRAEFAQLIKGIDNPNMAELPFNDVAGHWGIGAISQAYANKRIEGYPDNSFRPNNDITRAEAVVILNNLFDRKVDEAGLANVRKDIVEFKDLSRSHWAYYEIVEASNTHKFYRQKDGEVTEAWVSVLKTWNDFLK